MRLINKEKIKELATFQKNNVLMTDNDYKELKLGQLENLMEKYGFETVEDMENFIKKHFCKYSVMGEYKLV